MPHPLPPHGLEPAPTRRQAGVAARFLTRPASERRLLLQAWVALAFVRAALWLQPLKPLHRRLRRHVAARRRTGVRQPVERTAWAVRAGSRFVPAASCLTQALALQLLLARQGHPSRLHVGFLKPARGPVQGHAWLEHRGRVVIGDRNDRGERGLTLFTTAVTFDLEEAPCQNP